MTASPISDLIPLLMAAGAELYVMSKGSSCISIVVFLSVDMFVCLFYYYW